MKRWIALAMSACLGLTFWTNPIKAEEEPADSPESVVESATSVSQLTVSLDAALSNVTMDLVKGDLRIQPEVVGNSYIFKNIQTGNYVLEVNANGLSPYTQEISMENMDYSLTLSLCPAAVEGIGTMMFGDIDQDGQVSEADASLVIDAIEQGNASLDLNGDGMVDLLDLQSVTNWIGVKQEVTPAKVLGSVSQNQVSQIMADEDTLVEGSLEDLFVEDGNSLKLSSVNEGPISEESPVSIQFDLIEPVTMGSVALHSVPGQNQVESGILILELEDGTQKEISFGTSWFRNASSSIIIDLGGQIAVKKVTIKITSTQKNTNLAEISSVEFVNDMENHLPEPELNIPQNIKAEPGNKSFVVSWDSEVNVSGYEVEVSGNGKSKVFTTTQSTITIFDLDGKLVNKQEYTVRVRSMNGRWRSPYSESIVVVPLATEAPYAPDLVQAKGAYRSITVSWKAMEDTDYYTLFYRQKDKGEYESITNILSNSYTLSDLKDDTAYQFYVVGVNEIGSSSASLIVSATTANVMPAILPGYKLINTDQGTGNISSHILDVSVSGGTMINSEKLGAKGLVDNDYSTYLDVRDWDFGATYPGNRKGINVTFDSYYEIGMIALSEIENAHTLSVSNVKYVDSNGSYQTVRSQMIQKKDENGRHYYLITLDTPIYTNFITLGIGYSWPYYSIRPAEIRFYGYDSLENDVNSLYQDDLHIELKEEVKKETLDQLQDRLDTKVDGEYHPKRNEIQKTLDEARALYETKGLLKPVTVDPTINKSKMNVSGLNAWQPLGISAKAGENLVIYVGSSTKKTGENASLSLVATQVHGEASNFYKTVGNLKIGRNEITVPELSSVDAEHGGALYVEYTGNNLNESLAVRVSGGISIPVLNLKGVQGSKREEKIQDYMETLKSHVSTLEQQHDKEHSGHAYDPKLCIANVTDIVLDQMMISVPASQILAGSKKSAQQLGISLDAMDEMLELFYQQKGMTNSFEQGSDPSIVKANSLPSAHLNIRYSKMFGGAFMYAAGNHIGIEYDQCAPLASSQGVIVDENGLKLSGDYFGWGIAHEIGHELNDPRYTVVEVTNNYYSLIATAGAENDTVRFDYEDVFKKVTSGNQGASNDVFTNLAMYWQLHLAYDSDYGLKKYSTYQEMFDSLFYARLDSYARSPSLAPGNLVLDGDAYQNFMRLASAAAQKDLRDFFKQWGFEANEASAAYMGQFEKETRALAYANDTIRTQFMGTESSIATIDSVEIASIEPNTVTLNFSTSDPQVWGYEITRSMIVEGEEISQIVGFTQQDTFTDMVSGLGNKTVTYSVRAINGHLERSQAIQTDAIKLQGDGTYSSKEFTAITNMISSDDVEEPSNNEDPCISGVHSAVEKVIDGNRKTLYQGQSDTTPEILIDLHEVSAVNGLRILSEQGTIQAKVEVSMDNETFIPVSDTEFGKGTVYFHNGKWTTTYDARYIRVLFPKTHSVSIYEIEVVGPSSDDVSLDVIGILKEDFYYDENSAIPSGSLVFYGKYKGNPAYNVVLVYDEQGNIVGGMDEEGNLSSNQIILAPDPEDGFLGNVSEGQWIYWIDPQNLSDPSKVRVELYRVDDALTNGGQRMVSDTPFVNWPDQLENVEIQKGGNK